MREIGPGVHHWKARHPRIQVEVSSYYVEPAATLVDPLEPPEGIEWFESRTKPERVVLTNRHHYRHSGRFAEAFGCPVLCNENGLHEFDDGREVEGFAFGDALAEGITAVEVGVLCPEETALHIQIGDAFVSLADSLTNYEELGFVSDGLLGDDPEAIKRGLLDSLRRLLDLDFDGLLLAHGEPIVPGGKERLGRFVEQ
jgi:glyoxylase-like metal-dependent hydrolase (beta-lactamase superfamily II)